MTANGTLYVDEECAETFSRILDDWFGKESWKLDGDEWAVKDEADLPKQMVVRVVLAEDGKTLLGKVRIINHFEIVGDGAGKYIEIMPKDIKLLGHTEHGAKMLTAEKLLLAYKGKTVIIGRQKNWNPK